MSPIDSNFLLVGGIDLYRSADGGLTLVKISDWTKYHTGLSAHADQHAIVADSGFNGTTDKRVYFGNDGGIQTTANILTVTTTTGWTNLANGLGITQFYHGAAAADGALLTTAAWCWDRLRP